MTGFALRWLAIGFLIAVVVAVICSIADDLHAQSITQQPQTPPQTVIVYRPSYTICDLLEPYGESWFFFNCQSKSGAR